MLHVYCLLIFSMHIFNILRLVVLSYLPLKVVSSTSAVSPHASIKRAPCFTSLYTSAEQPCKRKGWLFWGFESLLRYFSHIATWKQEKTNLWNRSGETRIEPLASFSASLTTTQLLPVKGFGVWGYLAWNKSPICTLPQGSSPEFRGLCLLRCNILTSGKKFLNSNWSSCSLSRLQGVCWGRLTM